MLAKAADHPTGRRLTDRLRQQAGSYTGSSLTAITTIKRVLPMTSLNLTTPLHMARTIGLCFLVALMEGLDLQASGIAAQGMAAAFELDKLHMSWVFSAGIFGLLPGAFAGGLAG